MKQFGKKRESYLDTAQSLDAYNPKVIVIRSSESGVPEFLARHVGASILNTGNGWYEHLTQALLDALMMLDYFQSSDLSGKKVCIVGDILHSQVFGSLVRILKKLGAEIVISCPLTLKLKYVENFE